MSKCRPYPTDVSDEERHFDAPYLTLMSKDAPLRQYELREIFDALRRIARMLHGDFCPNDFPRWKMVHQQTPRWIRVGCFEAISQRPAFDHTSRRVARARRVAALQIK